MIRLWARPGSVRISGRYTSIAIILVALVWYLFGMFSDFNRPVVFSPDKEVYSYKIDKLLDVWSTSTSGIHLGGYLFLGIIVVYLLAFKEEGESENYREGLGLLTRMEWNRMVIVYLISECFAFAGLIWGWGNSLDAICMEHDPQCQPPVVLHHSRYVYNHGEVMWSHI
jgi:hypothetical protein